MNDKKMFRSLFPEFCLEKELDLFHQSEGDGKESVWQYLDQCRQLCACLLVNPDKRQFRQFYIDKLYALERLVLWQELQLCSALKSLCRFLLDLPVQLPEPRQLSSGFAPIESANHWSYVKLPSFPFHAETGLYWALIGHLFRDSTFLSAASKIADWELNLLDHHYYPFIGILCQENEVALDRFFISRYLLFRAVSSFSDRPDLDYAASMQLGHLQNLSSKSISLPEFALESWIEANREAAKPETEIPLPSSIFDLSNGLAGFRAPKECLISSLKGNGTGIAAFYREDVHMVSCGPHQLPLGDCQGFGISQAGHPVFQGEANQKKLFIHGTVKTGAPRKVDEPLALYREGKESADWLEIKQVFENGSLKIQTYFLNPSSIETTSFVFFVKGALCKINHKDEIRPCSLKGFSGPIQPIQITGEKSQLSFLGDTNCPEMQVIPLAGGNNFWGADFLIAYFLKKNLHHYSWQIS